MPSHTELDERSLALHRVVAARLRAEPGRMAHVAATLARWRSTVSPHTQGYLQRWEALLALGQEACLAKAEEDSQDAAAMRQASPFTGILSERERVGFLKQWRKNRAKPAV